MAKKKNPIPLWDRPTFVYRIFDRGGSLLYVGISDNQWTRIEGGHKKSAPWFVDAKSARVELYQDRHDAVAVESWAIAHESPQHNYEPGTKYLPVSADLVPSPLDVFTRTLYQPIKWSND